MGPSSAPGRPAITEVVVVIPAHNEQEHVRACLVSVQQAAIELARVRPAVQVATVLVLDRCSDGTAAIARELGVATVVVDAGSVGAARRAGVDAVTRRVESHRATSTLVVNTDADCVAPSGWLIEHVSLAADHDLVLGEVEPNPAEMSPASLAAWWERHPRGRGSLHGANLAVRLDAYLRAGGFPEVCEKEDVLLVRALRADGAEVVGGTRVMTSGRREGRVAGGFAGYLRWLDAELAEEMIGELAVELTGELALPSAEPGPGPRS